MHVISGNREQWCGWAGLYESDTEVQGMCTKRAELYAAGAEFDVSNFSTESVAPLPKFLVS